MKDWSIYIGKKYNNLIVLDTFKKHNGKRNIRYFHCKCLRCGKEFDSCADDVLRTDNRATKSCGCLQKEVAGEIGKVTGKRNIKFAYSNPHNKYKYKVVDENGKSYPIYVGYRCMIQRCYNENDICYNNYGGRGITVCDEWLNYDNYYDWAICNGYKDGYTLHRLNNNKNYEPNNVIFLSKTDHNTVTQFMRKNKLSYMPIEDIYQIIYK